MTEQEFERLRRRFGADVSAWPAPHRREAARFVAGAQASGGADDALDGLVLAAADVDTDEVILARKVLARVNAPPPAGVLSGGFWRPRVMPLAMSGFAALLAISAVGGYVVAGNPPQGLDDALLALALGDGSLGGAGRDLIDGLEEAL